MCGFSCGEAAHRDTSPPTGGFRALTQWSGPVGTTSTGGSAVSGNESWRAAFTTSDNPATTPANAVLLSPDGPAAAILAEL